jgi:hypothetical protein
MSAAEFFALARDFEAAPARVGSAIFDAYRGAGEGFRDDWKHNAASTAGEHGKWYPDAITTEMKFAGLGVEVETGPERGPKQGGMSFEFGSRNQPPHLDGLRAMPLAAARLDKLTDAAIAFALP